MRSELQVLPLKDCLEALIDYRGKTPRKTDSGIPLITAKVVKGGRIETPNEFIAPEDFDSWMTRGLPKVGDVVMTTEAPLGEVGQILSLPVALAQRIVTLRGKPHLLDNDYLLYLLQAETVQEQIKGRSSGTTVVGIKQSELRNVRLSLPPVQQQREVASILRALDQRIDLLRQTNATLESIAQALFKSWFIDFDPVRAKAEGREPEGIDATMAALFPAEFEESALGLIPKGWGVVPFAETVNIMGGGTPKTSVAEFWGGNIPWFSVVDAPSPGQVFTLRTEKFVTTVGVDNSSTRVLPAWTTIISARGTVGKLAMTACPMAMNQSCYGLVPKFPGTEPLVYLAAQRLVDDLKRLAHGGVFDTITRDTLSSVNVVYAAHEVQTNFAAMVRPMFRQILEGVARMSSLAELRDTLLPRLISGKLRLPEAQAQLEDALA